MALSDILNTFKKQGKNNDNILPLIDRYILSLDGKEMKDKTNNRATDCYHPSSLSTTKCNRALVYSWLKTNPSNPQKNTAKGRRIFDVGHHFGYILQQYLWDMGILEGNWHCVECKHDWWDISPNECPNCNSKMEIWYNLHYKEVPIFNKNKNIVGHADGIVVTSAGKRMMEFKSIKNRDYNTREHAVTYDDLIQAKEEHQYQCQLYLDRDTMRFLDVKMASVLYFAKNTQDIKEFTVTAMPELVQPMYDRIDSVNYALENGILPKRISEDKSCSDCKWCPFKDYCFTEHSFQDADGRDK